METIPRYKGDPDNWSKLSKKLKETALRSALIDQSLRDMRHEDKLKEAQRTGLQITETVLECVRRLHAIWQKELDRREAQRQEIKAMSAHEEIEALEKELK